MPRLPRRENRSKLTRTHGLGLKVAAGVLAASSGVGLVASPGLSDLSRDAFENVSSSVAAASKGARDVVDTLAASRPGVRELTSSEARTLAGVYGDALDTSRIRVVEAESRDGISARPVTLKNYIIAPSSSVGEDGRVKPTVLVHEAAHVWQFQNGGLAYIADSAEDQLQAGEGAYAYAEAVLKGTPWAELHTEQQAQVLQHAFRQGFFRGNSFLVEGRDRTQYLREALADIRAGEGAPTFG